MTYLQFHLVFTLPAAFTLAYTGPLIRSKDGWKAIGSIGVIMLIAFAYTTPWDNYLVRTGVWGYGDGRVLGTLGHVPIEEYFFFLIQPVITGLWFYNLLWSRGPEISPSTSNPAFIRWTGFLGLVLTSVAGFAMLGHQATRYLALILVWAGPVLAIQWLYGGPTLWQYRRTMFSAIWPPTLYLWVIDRVAIGLDIWHISPVQTTGFHLFGLPIEEALFFFMTNILVVQGTLLSMTTLKVSIFERPSPLFVTSH